MKKIILLMWSSMALVLLSAGMSSAEKGTKLFNQWSVYEPTSGGECYILFGGTKGLRLYKRQIGKSKNSILQSTVKIPLRRPQQLC